MKLDSALRIGEMAKRTGIRPERLRAWERRYGLLKPSRTSGGFRVYSDADLLRVEEMKRLTDSGIAPAEAAKIVLRSSSDRILEAKAEPDAPANIVDSLFACLTDFDEDESHQIFDTAIASLSTPTVLRDVVMPILKRTGDLWESGEIHVGHEHYVSNFLRGRLFGLARGWGNGAGPKALLANPPNERHDLPLVVFGVALHEFGWRIAFVGANTPIAALEGSIDDLSPDLVVMSAIRSKPFSDCAGDLARISRKIPLMLGGRGATDSVGKKTKATILNGDPVTEAHRRARA